MENEKDGQQDFFFESKFSYQQESDIVSQNDSEQYFNNVNNHAIKELKKAENVCEPTNIFKSIYDNVYYDEGSNSKNYAKPEVFVPQKLNISQNLEEKQNLEQEQNQYKSMNNVENSEEEEQKDDGVEAQLKQYHNFASFQEDQQFFNK